MKTPYDSPELLEKWSKLERELKDAYGMSDYAVHSEIAGIYGVSRATVYAYLHEGMLEKKRAYDRDYNTRRYVDVDQSVLDARRDYNRKYADLRAHLDSYLLQLFADDQPRTVEDISNYVASRTGITLRKRTIENILAGYEQRLGQQPLIELNGNSSLYVLNRDFYSG
jgi:hypothetical protein